MVDVIINVSILVGIVLDKQHTWGNIPKKDIGLIMTLGSAREKTRFDANLSPHHHFVCGRCGLGSLL